MSQVEITCDRVAFINHGRIIHSDTMANLLRQTTEVTVRAEPLSADLLASLAQMEHNLQTNGNTVSLFVDDAAVMPRLFSRRDL